MTHLNSTSPRLWRQGTLVYTTAGLVSLFCWLLWGDFAWAMKDRAIGPSATLLIRMFDVSDLVYTLIIIAFPNFTNIFLCPIISYISDRHRGKFGRRIPFLLFTTPFIVIGLIGLGFTPMLGDWLYRMAGAEQLSRNTAGLIFFGIFWVMLDFGATLAGALSGALINDVVPSELLGRFFALFRAVSLIAGMLFNAFLIGLVESYSLYIFVGVGIFYGIGLLSLCTKVKEGGYPPVAPAVTPVGVKNTVFRPVATYFRQSFSISYYRWVIVGLVFSYLAAVPFNIFSIFYAKSLNMDMHQYGLLITLTYAVSLVMSYFLGMLADRYHPLRTTLTAQILYLFTMLIGWFTVTGNTSFGVLLVIHGIISGCFFTLSASLGQKLFPRELFAQFNSAFSMLLAIGNVVLGPFFGWLLDHLGRDYRYTFLFGTVLTALSVISLWQVFRGYLACGGDAAYTPPDPGE